MATGLRCSLLLTGVLSVTVLQFGCGSSESEVTFSSTDDSVPGPEGAASGGSLLEVAGDLIDSTSRYEENEDPEVLAWLKQKGWQPRADIRMQDSRHLIYLNLSNPPGVAEDYEIPEDDWTMLARSTAIQVLNLQDIAVTDAALAILAKNTAFEALLISGDNVTDAGLAAVAGMENVDNLTLTLTKNITDAGVAQLAAMPKLSSLYLLGFPFTGEGLAPFAETNRLKFLGLEMISGFAHEAAAHLARMTALEHLKLKVTGYWAGETTFTSASLQSVAEAHVPDEFEFDLPLLDDKLLATLLKQGWRPGDSPPDSLAEVSSINLEESAVTDAGFKPLLACTATVNLFLGNTALTDATFTRLGTFSQLEYVSLKESRITAAGLEVLAELPLTHLALENTELTEPMFEAIGKMSMLEELWLSESKFDPAWLQHLGGLSNLDELNLRRAAFNDDAVEHLLDLPRLEELTLNDTELTDAGLARLVQKPSLRMIYVSGTKVTEAACEKAKADRPKLILSH